MSLQAWRAIDSRICLYSASKSCPTSDLSPLTSALRLPSSLARRSLGEGGRPPSSVLRFEELVDSKKCFITIWGRSDQRCLFVNHPVAGNPIVGVPPAIFVKLMAARL